MFAVPLPIVLKGDLRLGLIKVIVKPKTADSFGWHYLSNTTCLMRPHLFSAALLV